MLSVASTMTLLHNLVPFSVYNIKFCQGLQWSWSRSWSVERYNYVTTLEDDEYAVVCMCVCVCVCVFVCAHVAARVGKQTQVHACMCVCCSVLHAFLGVHLTFLPRLSVTFNVLSFFSVPSAPLGLRATDVGPFRFSLVWNSPSSPNGNIAFYQVELFADNNIYLPALNPVNVSSTSYNFTGLAPFTGYSVQVCAYTIGCGDIATLNVTTLGGEKGQITSKKRQY